jgi:hypothetical protein
VTQLPSPRRQQRVVAHPRDQRQEEVVHTRG